EEIQKFYENCGTVVAYGRLPNASAERRRGDPRVSTLIEKIFGIGPEQQVKQVVERKNSKRGKAYFVPENESRVPELISNAIVTDVASHARDIFHTHQKAGDLDIYFLFNAKPERRSPSFRFRTNGEPEIWDAFTGKTQPIY